MRIIIDAPFGRGNADTAKHLDGLRPRLLLSDVGVDTERLGDLMPDREHRIERAHRLLKDHGYTPAAYRAHRVDAARGKIDVIEHDRAVHADQIVRQEA